MRSKSIFFLRRISFTLLLLLLFIYLFFLNRRISITNFIQELQIKRNVDRSEEIPKVIGFQFLSWGEKKKGKEKKGKDDFLPLRRNGLSSIVSNSKDGNVDRETKWKFIEIECQDF